MMNFICCLPPFPQIYDTRIKRLNQEILINFASKLLHLTYKYQAKELPDIIDHYLAELPGGQDWFE